MTFPTCDNDCAWNGYTKELIACSALHGDMHISVKPDTDLDDYFFAFCHDMQEMIKVYGWLFTFEEVA